MDQTIPQQVVIENVIQSKMRGKVIYQSNVPASIALNLTFVKPYDNESGKGYQRPVDPKRCHDFALYLSKGDDALFTPVLLNACSNWEFVAYDKQRPNFGRLFCKGKASLMDGQHRLGGIKRYIQETNADIMVPFLAFHSLDEDEEIRLFDTINTKAKGIGSSLSKYLRRDSDELSWVATELLVRKDSPFYNIGSIIGKRAKGRHITLQNLYRTLHFLFKKDDVALLTKEEKLNISLFYFNTIKDTFSYEWLDYGGHRLTHIVCLDALSIAAGSILNHFFSNEQKTKDYSSFAQSIQKLRKVDWSTTGHLRYLKGLSGSKTLASELSGLMIN
ncbi:DGQHR domain-containing protein [Paenibacillus rhizovicinus]|uniref:DGQHR domain-containing protein n=2 Tax=Paenibacillus rhizovicinus TaxID=2704463 RepID=A0A6C0P8Y5_9BACL|nr:DGQHR domain-containing protein [Paenibacillus rhizovicinus]QHW34845.1 DGQHR domain-containing protein [Paenibacillus rhizovicinus]